VPVGAQLRGEPGINEELFATPPTRPRRSRISDLPEAPPARKAGAFAAVALLLLGATLGGTLYLYRSGALPRWSGAAPPSDEGRMEPISRTEVTNALIETTQLTPPPALENAMIEPENKPTTATTDDDIEVTESPSTTPPMETNPADQAEPAKKTPQLGSGPAMPPSSSKAKRSPATDDETPPAQPWAGTSPPPTTSAPTTDDADDTASPSAPPTAPTTTPTAPPSEEPRITDEPSF
jgi:hypothetical protein